MTEGEGQVFAVGSRVSRSLLVQVTDEAGKPVSGVTISFTLPPSGPTGTFAGNMRTDITTTANDGRVMMSSVDWNKTPGPLTIRITARKDEVRAGIVSAQYLSDTVPAAAGRRLGPRAFNRWWMTAAIIGGAAGGGLALGMLRGSSSPATVAAPATSVTIGTPTISVGKP